MDEQIILWVSENLQHEWLNPLMIGVSALGNMGMVFILMSIVMVVVGKRNAVDWREKGFLLLVCVLGTAILVNLILKPWVARIRPYDVLGFALIIPPPHDFSFPSGHTAAAFATAVVFMSFNRGWGIGMFAFAVVMGFSRLYLLVHFPSDILCGALLGVVVSSLIIWFWKNWCKKRRMGQ